MASELLKTIVKNYLFGSVNKMVNSMFSLIILVMIKENFAVCPDCNCISKRRLLELLQLVNTTVVECNPIQPSIITATPKRQVSISNPIGMIGDGNDIYISRYTTTGFVDQYDQDGNFQATFSIPEGTPRFLEIRDNNLYVTVESGSVYVKCHNEDSFTEFLKLDNTPNYITFTPDGEQFIITSRLSSTVVVYNKDKTINSTFTVTGDPRDVNFDDQQNVYVSNLSPSIQVYSKDYVYNRTITYSGIGMIDGWLFQCDGTKILADRAGRVAFIDEDDTLQQIHTDGFVGIIQVAITKSGALFVLDFDAMMLFIY